MTEEEKDNLLHGHLKLIVPAFGKLKLSEARGLIDRINDCLSDTPFMYFIFGDGVDVALREQMYNLNKQLFNVDTFREDR